MIRAIGMCLAALVLGFLSAIVYPSCSSPAPAPQEPPQTVAEPDEDETNNAALREARPVSGFDPIGIDLPAPARLGVAHIFFPFDSAEIDPTYDARLATLAGELRESGGTIRIEGNCDERGSDAYNMALGMRRAVAVANRLIRGGVAVDKIDLITHGKRLPQCTDHAERCWMLCRRADLVQP